MMFMLFASMISFAQAPNSVQGNAQQVFINPTVKVVDEMAKINAVKTKKELTDLLISNAMNASILDAQCKSLDITPVVMVPMFPSNLTKLKTKELRALALSYNDYALKLYNQLSSTPLTTIQSVQNLLKQREDQLTQVTYQNELEKMKIYDEQREKLHNYYEKLKEERLNEIFKNSVQVFNASLVGREFFLPGSGVTGDFSLGAKFELSLFPMFNAADFFELYGEFMKPRFYTHDVQGNEYAWNINAYNVGFNLKIPGRLDLDYFTMGLRMGAGYYWSEAWQYNKGGIKSDWRGYAVNFELDFMKYTWFYPLDIFVQYSLFYPTQNFAFSTPDGTINLGKGMYSGLSLGLRLCLWYEDKY